MDAEASTMQQDPLVKWWESSGWPWHRGAISCTMVMMGLVVLCCLLYCGGLCVQRDHPVGCSQEAMFLQPLREWDVGSHFRLLQRVSKDA